MYDSHPARDGVSKPEACKFIGGCADIVVKARVDQSLAYKMESRCARGPPHLYSLKGIEEERSTGAIDTTGKGRTIHVPPLTRVEAIKTRRARVLRTTILLGLFPQLQQALVKLRHQSVRFMGDGNSILSLSSCMCRPVLSPHAIPKSNICLIGNRLSETWTPLLPCVWSFSPMHLLTRCMIVIVLSFLHAMFQHVPARSFF